MKLTPQLSLAFNGQCEKAFRFYAQSLHGAIGFMLTWANSPAAAEAPADWGEKIYHATLRLGDGVILGGDLPPDRYEQPKGFQIILQMNDVSAADQVFHALSKDGTIVVPLRKTFWAARFGVLVDQFAITWSVNCENPLA